MFYPIYVKKIIIVGHVSINKYDQLLFYKVENQRDLFDTFVKKIVIFLKVCWQSKKDINK